MRGVGPRIVLWFSALSGGAVSLGIVSLGIVSGGMVSGGCSGADLPSGDPAEPSVRDAREPNAPGIEAGRGDPDPATPSPSDPSTPPGRPTTGACAGKPRIGDPGSVYDPSLDDPRYPMMKEWAKAGVEGGIPEVTEIAATLGPSDGLAKIQAAIDAAATTIKSGQKPASFKVVLLKNGRYEIDGAMLNPILVVKSGVVLRGESRDGTVLSFTTARDGREYDFSIGVKAWAGLESLTVTNRYVEGLDESTYLAKYSNVEVAGKGAYLSGVTLQGDDAWVQGTKISKIGTHPIFLGGRHHCTLRDNVVEKALNKGGGGRGYYYIAASSSYNLVYHEKISDLRHFTYLMGVHHNVVLNVTTSVDLNFHNKPQMPMNLFEGIDSRIPSSHTWGKGASWGFGWYTVDVTEADHNVAYKMTTLPGYPETKPYLILRDYSGGTGNRFQEIAPPRAGTFYPVSGCREAPPS
jgi:hypothetical protein